MNCKQAARPQGKRSLSADNFLCNFRDYEVVNEVTGILLSWGVISVVQLIPSDDGPMQFLGKPILSSTIMLLTTGILTAIGLMAGFFPARRAASVDPVESLRYE